MNNEHQCVDYVYFCTKEENKNIMTKKINEKKNEKKNIFKRKEKIMLAINYNGHNNL